MRKRAQDEYLFACGFALIAGLFMAVVIWNTATASGRPPDAFRVTEPIDQVAAGSTSTSEAPGPGTLAELARKLVGPEFVASSPSSPAEFAAEVPRPVSEQIQVPAVNATAPASTFIVGAPWNYALPVAGHVGLASASTSGPRAPLAFAGLPGGYYPAGRAVAKSSTEQASLSTEQASVAEETPHAVVQSGNRQHLTVADSAPAESIAAAPVSSTSANADVPAPAVESHTGGPSISIPSLSTPSSLLAATLDSLVPPATLDALAHPAAVSEVSSWPASDLSAVTVEDTVSIPVESLFDNPDPIVQLVERYGDPLAALAQPDLGVEPPPVTVTTTEKPSLNPEPATLLLLGTGLGLVSRRLRRRGQSDPGLA